MKFYFGILISLTGLNFCFANDVVIKSAVVKPQTQELRLGFRNFDVKQDFVSNIKRQLKVTLDGLVVLEEYSLNLKKNNPGNNPKADIAPTPVNVKYLSETQLTPKFEWKSTRLIQTSTEKKTALFTVAGKEIIVSSQADASPVKIKKLSYNNNALPLSAVPYFLFNQGRKQIGIPNDLDIFLETEQSLIKTSWVYLGSSLENQKKIHRFEINGGLSQMIYLDAEGRILKIKDLRKFFELNSI